MPRHVLAEAYMEELTRGEPVRFMQPNFWPNTPDILPQPRQVGGPAHVFRLRRQIRTERGFDDLL